MSPGAALRTIIPNDVVRRVRRDYLSLLAASLVLGFVTFLLGGNGLVPPFITMLLLIASAGLLVFAVLVLRSGICPRCGVSLMWKESPGLTASRIALLTRKQCPKCSLVLDEPFTLVDEQKS